MARVRSTASRLLRLLEQSPDPVYLLDERRSIVYCNQACAQWTGVAAEDLQGRRVDYVAGDHRSGPPGVAAGLCPPPETFAGQESIGHVSCISGQGRLVYRRARFLPLGETEAECVGAIVLVESFDSPAAELDGRAENQDSADRLHLAIRRFRVEQGEHYALEQLVGISPGIQRARTGIRIAASAKVNVVAIGPAGSGRAHVARSIHYQAATAGRGQLVPLDARLVDLEQLQATLVSLRRASDASATATLLLTDVDELAESAQAYLARELVQTTQTTRILATARRSLLHAADEGGYDRELAHRLAELEIQLPALRERREDLPLLCQAFLEQANAQGGKQLSGVGPEALDLLALHDWPGNLDELREATIAAHRACGQSILRPEDFPSRYHHAADSAERPRRHEETIDLESFLCDVEIKLIRRAMRQAGGNKAHAARLLSMPRARLYRRLEQLGLADTQPPSEAEPD